MAVDRWCLACALQNRETPAIVKDAQYGDSACAFHGGVDLLRETVTPVSYTDTTIVDGLKDIMAPPLGPIFLSPKIWLFGRKLEFFNTHAC
jgi:hypothetical protein